MIKKYNIQFIIGNSSAIDKLKTSKIPLNMKQKGFDEDFKVLKIKTKLKH